jgi:hypothetical protein
VEVNQPGIYDLKTLIIQALAKMSLSDLQQNLFKNDATENSIGYFK